MRHRVAFVTNALTLGGTEKMLVSCATRIDRERFDVHVVCVLERGPRADELLAAGIPVSCAEGDGARLAQLLRGTHLVHVFRHGIAEPIVPAACREAGVRRLVELNVFGSVDSSDDERQFDCHLFMSKMTLLRYRNKVGDRSHAFHKRHRVLSAPIEHRALRRHAPSRTEARRQLGLHPDRPVVGRIGRAADLKWRRLIVDMVPHLLAIEPRVQVLLIGATPAKVARLRRLGVLDRCVLHDPSPDDARLATYYAACDVFASAAEIGESQGVAIGEALGFELPVVTSSTPWTDNAQVEFVEHGRTGWLASHPRSFAEAVDDLLRDEDRRARFGRAGREDMERTLSPDDIGLRLDGLYGELLGDGRAPAWSPGPEQIDAFARDYRRRAYAEFRPLTLRERGEVRADRLRERATLARTVAAPVLARVKGRLG
jgi:glycosyltransferase involved in cell wall biosynthesis